MHSVPQILLNFKQLDGEDFTGGSFSRSLNTSSSGCIVISITNDGTVEGDESFTVGVSTTDTAVSISPSIATVVIVDNDGGFNTIHNHGCLYSGNMYATQYIQTQATFVIAFLYPCLVVAHIDVS